MSNEELILSPIHEAAKRGYSAQIEELLVQVPNAQEKEKLLASVDTYGNTALHWACGGGHEDTAEMLLKLYNKNVNAKNHFGDTPLHRAAWRGFDKVCEVLLKYGAAESRKIENREGKTPLNLARKYEVRALVAPPQEGNDEEFDMEDDDSD